MLYTLQQIGLVLVCIFLLALVLWYIGQFFGWVLDEIALLRTKK